MALGPDRIATATAGRIARAEEKIDAAIRDAHRPSVRVNAGVALTQEEFRNHLRPRYLQAGWRVAELISDNLGPDLIRLET